MTAPRTLSVARQAASAARVTRPGILVEIYWSVVGRYSSIGDVLWAGNSYVAADVMVSNLKWDAKGEQSGRLTLGNADLAAGALLLNEDVADRRIVIYDVDAAALADDDPVCVFDGVGDAASLDPESHKLIIELASGGTQTTFLPRRFISPATGFNHLQPAGTRIAFGNEVYTLERR